MATEQVAEQVIEQVAEGFEEAAQVTRSINVSALGYLTLGLGVGVAVGFFFGRRWNREKIRAEAFAESEEEVEKIKAYYQQKVTAARVKPSVEEVIEEKGYSTSTIVVEPERPLKPPVPISGHPFAPSKDPKRTAAGEKQKNDGWNYAYELSQRSPDRPFVIHQDEFFSHESGYSQTTYSYYAGDDVLADENDSVLSNIDNLVGTDNINRWGHGSDDFNVVYIRNPVLELEFEVCRTPKSYEEEVMGLEREDETT
jgi:hypothetical protein